MKNILASLFIFLCYSQLTAQCIVLQNCQTSAQACDNSLNNSALWNEVYWFDPANNVQDLADAVVTSTLTINDTCPSAIVGLRYLLFLDLDKNGSWETVIKSWEPPAAGTVNFNNWNNPNYDGGDVRIFDERPVAAGDKYQFAIEATLSGNQGQAHLRWNTPNQPNTYVNVELPYATHKIKWLADDNLGNNAVCEYPIVVKDCQKPTVVCLNGLTVNILSSAHVTLWAADFLQYTLDNTSPGSVIQIGIRKAGTGTGFPTHPDGTPVTDVTFNCAELGTQTVDLWARDAEGNADFCQTYVIVQSNDGGCDLFIGADSIPKVVCQNGLSVNIMASGQIQLPLSSLLQYAVDDNTPSNLIDLSIRKCGTGVNFPVDGNGDPVLNLTFSCSEMGTQCIELWARDLDGNATFCETYIIVQDNVGHCPNGNGPLGAPTIACINGLSVNLLATGQIELWNIDFLDYAEDDLTPANLLEFGIRKCGTGAGFPMDGNNNGIQKVFFDCDEIGTQCVELWAKDQDGNADYCETYVIVQDNFGSCSQFDAHITACITSHCNASPVHGASLSAGTTYMGFVGPLDPGGCAIFPVGSSKLGNINIIPSNSLFPLNGVTVFDLVKIKRFILGLDTDLTPYDIIAADANKSGTITGFDLIELRKLLLGITSALPNNKSWRFVDANFVFPNPQNPFQTVFPEFVNISNAMPDSSYQVRFTAIKVGDLDCDAWPGLQAPSHDRGLPTQRLTLPDATLRSGSVSEITLQMAEAGNWSGLQIGLQFDPEKVEILEVVPGNLPALDADAFYQPIPGMLHFVWAHEQAPWISSGQDILSLRVRALETVETSNIFKTTADFEQLGILNEQPQSLALDFRQDQQHPVSFEETLISAPQPNPTNTGTSIPVRLAQAERVRVEVTDLSGKMVWANVQDLSAGNHLLEIAAQAMPQAGVYVWRVQTGSKSASGKLVKI